MKVNRGTLEIAIIPIVQMGITTLHNITILQHLKLPTLRTLRNNPGSASIPGAGLRTCVVMVANYIYITSLKFQKKKFGRNGINCLIIGGFPIEIETQISKLITYSLAIFKL